MERIEVLRDIAARRLERLEKKAQKIGEHLKRKPGDLQAAHYLLHQVAVEFHDVQRNLNDKNKPDWVPKAKRKKGRRAIPDPTPIPEREKGEAGTPKCYKLQRPVPLPKDRIPEDQQEMGRGSGGRSWCSPPFVEVALPPRKEDVVLACLEPLSNKHDREIINAWVEDRFGSIDEAKPALKEGARVSTEPNVWRALLERAGKAEKFQHLCDEDLLGDNSASNIAKKWHQIGWVDDYLTAIGGKKADKNKGTEKLEGYLDEWCQQRHVKIDKDSFKTRLSGALMSFHKAANRDKHTNPQFPYLMRDKAETMASSVQQQVTSWLTEDTSVRFLEHPDDEKKRSKLTVIQKELGAAKRASHPRGSEKNEPWEWRPHWKGTVSRKRDAALAWDRSQSENGLRWLLTVGKQTKVRKDEYLYVDGTPLTGGSDGPGDKSGFAMPLILKHDFLRWFTKHAQNHDPRAPLSKRCIHNTTQFVICPKVWRKGRGHAAEFSLVEPTKLKGWRELSPRLFIRPVLKFYDPVKEIPDTHTWGAKPQCRYLIGIDRGINSPYFAAVYDCNTKTITHVRQGRGRKEEWKNLRNEIAAVQRERDLLRNAGAKERQLTRVQDRIRLLRKRERGLNKVETVEAIAELSNWAEATLGECNYCFVIEELAEMNLKRNNRVKNIAAIKDALVKQMRKKGYKYYEKRGKVDGVREESPWHTSAVSPFGWWAKAKEIDKDKRFIGRRVGGHYCCDAQDGLYLRGFYKKTQGKYGRPVFVLGEDDLNTGVRRRTFGSELFWDPNQTEFQGKHFPNGVILNADFVGAFNIALRPVVKDGQGKGFKAANMAEAHTEVNPTVNIECAVPVYEFVEVDGDPLGALREVVV
jgi:hypothetical protein